MLIRKPHVAGSFYPSDVAELREFFNRNLRVAEKPVSARAVILPHAGYVYSGKTACRVVSRVQVPEKVFVMGPNHHGYGAPFALSREGEWETPLGRVPIDSGLADRLLRQSSLLGEDDSAHAYEHSLEVLLPFLQIRNPHIRIVPLVLGASDLKAAEKAALGCAEVLSELREPLLIAVSTDMSHYESDKITRQKDPYALRAIENLDADALIQSVKQHRITMCGYLPVYMLLIMHRILRFKNAALIDYTTSADATGDRDRVVGYAGFVFE